MKRLDKILGWGARGVGFRWVGVVDKVRWDAFQKDFEVEEMYRTKPALKTNSHG